MSKSTPKDSFVTLKENLRDKIDIGLEETLTGKDQVTNENLPNKNLEGELKDLEDNIRSAFLSGLEKNVPTTSSVTAVGEKKVFVNKLVVDLEKTLIGLDTRIALAEKSDAKEPTPKPVKAVKTLEPDDVKKKPSISYVTQEIEGLEESVHFFEPRPRSVQKSVPDVQSDLTVTIQEKLFELIKEEEEIVDLKSALGKDLEGRLLTTIPSEEEIIMQLIEDLEDTLYDEGQNHWKKVPLQLKVDVIQSWTDRLAPSDHGISYKLTERSVLESEDKQVHKEEVAKVPVTLDDVKKPSIQFYPSEKSIIQEPARVLSLNDFQVNALQGLLNLGIDIEDSSLLDILQPKSPVTHIDWETLVSCNRLVGIPPINPTFDFPRDKARRQAPELSRAVRKQLVHILALKYRRERGVDKTRMKKILERMKKHVLPMVRGLSDPNVNLKEKKGEKVVLRLRFKHEQVLYWVLSENFNVGRLKNFILNRLKTLQKYLKKDFVDLSCRERLNVILSDDAQVYTDESLCLHDLPPLDPVYRIISLRVEFAVETEEIPVVPQETCTQKSDSGVKGYRHRTTHVTYYNACSQTVRPFDLGNLVSREAQTPAFPLLETATVTTVTTSTQMDREDYCVDERSDIILCPGRWVSNPAYDLGYQAAMAIRIQREWRNYLMEKYDEEIRNIVAKLRENDLFLKNRMEEGGCVRQMKVMLSPLYLNRKEDAYMLYIFLQSWWGNFKNSDLHRRAVETRRRKSSGTKCVDLKRACASKILLEEFKVFLTRLIAVEKSVHTLKSQVQDRVELKQLNETVKPLQLKKTKGAPVIIVTPQSQRCAQLKNIYKTLKKRDSTLEERVDLLLHVREFLINENKEIRLTERILSLINREIDYLNHSIAAGTQMEPLRARIELHFLKYITSRAVNPNMGKILDRKCPPTCGPELHYCNHCLKTKHADHFQTESFSNEVLRMCKKCFYTREVGNQREDFSQYTTMLIKLRHSELRRCTLSPVAFLIHEETVHNIVTLWGSRSPISGCEDLFKLRLTRWIIHLDWTPWNNILLTKEELANHVCVRHVQTLYSSAFIRNVWRINMNARERFGNLQRLEYYVKNILVMQGTAFDDFECSEEQNGEIEEECLSY